MYMETNNTICRYIVVVDTLFKNFNNFFKDKHIEINIVIKIF